MKNFALKYPFGASVIVFLAVFIGGTILSIILGFLLMLKYSGDCSAPCDGGAMGAAAIWYVGFFGSLGLGILATLTSFVILILKIKRKEEQSYK